MNMRSLYKVFQLACVCAYICLAAAAYMNSITPSSNYCRNAAHCGRLNFYIILPDMLAKRRKIISTKQSGNFIPCGLIKVFVFCAIFSRWFSNFHELNFIYYFLPTRWMKWCRLLKQRFSHSARKEELKRNEILRMTASALFECAI